MARVLHVRQSARYGLERLIVESGAILKRCHGYDVGILLWYSHRGLAEAVRRTLPEVHPVVGEARTHGLWAEQWLDRGKLAIGMVGRLVRFIREREVTLIHTHDPKSDLFGWLAARIAGVPIVATAHGYHDALRRIRVYREMDLLALRVFARVIAVSDAFSKELIAAGVPSDKVITIHDAIDAGAFRSNSVQDIGALRSELELSLDHCVVSVVARLIPEKGHMDFLRAARRVAARFTQTRFLIVGEGRLQGDLEIAARNMGIADKVAFLGHRRDVAALMQLSDVIVSPSVRDFLPNVILEAGAVSRPVVATAVGGVPEMVVQGETGLLVPPGDPDALAGAIGHVLSDPELSSSMGRCAKRMVEVSFSVGAMAEATARVYESVLGESRAEAAVRDHDRLLRREAE